MPPKTTTVPTNAVEPTIGLDRVRSSLATLWLTGSGLLIFVLVLQSLLGHYEDKVQEVWGWVLPTIMPTLAMIVAVLGYTALEPDSLRSVVRRSFFRIAIWLSLFYILLIVLTVVIQPFVGATGEKAVQLMRLSNLWLGPMQGLVDSSLGVLFVSKKQEGG